MQNGRRRSQLHIRVALKGVIVRIFDAIPGDCESERENYTLEIWGQSNDRKWHRRASEVPLHD